MHITLHELLSLRDDAAADSAAAAHVQTCSQCRAELDRLRTQTANLRALPPRWTPPERWDAVSARLGWPSAAPIDLQARRRASTHKRQPTWFVPVTAAASVVIAIVLTSRLEHRVPEINPDTASETTQTQTNNDSLPSDLSPVQTLDPNAPPAEVLADQQRLVRQSQQLEAKLNSLPEEPRVTRAQTALTLADIEDRIRWVDYQLALGMEAGLEPQAAQALWRQRVDLLNSLVAVRYAQAQTHSLAF
jgi:hypothetical protein